ncbi:aspartyl-phosphate phosphatase Spo0E family protein [Anaerobacillus isosaccharinicus]|uniref:Aspartyl-phosphate phosphatase Spo0E family protein n=1 Tax=Anaerobacillus isosaccharinicus TaxID=1532552 RepID=A0A7S7LCG7_9BACI|nr:aspartyl-phosphate phosphatase Spo0E family protein [Anaerobacillus isosaccharinicus]
MGKIEERMENLRKQLNEFVVDIDNCCEEKILEISEELDQVILEYMKAEK